MTWAERYVDERGLWVLIHTPRPDGRCIFGEPWPGEHMHLIEPRLEVVS
jgi:hypothetical protein